jgi:hypothetical protein
LFAKLLAIACAWLNAVIYASSGETVDDAVAVADVVTKTYGSVVVVANPVAPAVAV